MDEEDLNKMLQNYYEQGIKLGKTQQEMVYNLKFAIQKSM